MKKINCVVCSSKKGKRICQIHSEEYICPRCCAQLRNAACEGCRYYVQAGQYSSKKKSTVYPEILMRIDPEVDEAVEQALLLVERGFIKAAEKKLSELLEYAEDIYTVQYGMGVVRAFQNRHDEAISRFDKALEIYPYFIESWYNKAVAHKEKLDIGNMIRSFKKVIEYGDPQDKYVVQSKHLLSDFERHIQEENGIALDQYLLAEEKFREAFKQMEKKSWEKAALLFKESIALNPGHPQSFGNLGLCYAYLGHKEEAFAAFDQALELDPDYEPAQINRDILLRLDKQGKDFSKTEIRSIEYYREQELKKSSKLSRFFSRE